jgi:Protein of unknown function (DUF3617)
MTRNFVLAATVAATFSTAAAAAGPFDQFKGKMKDGMYEYKMTMDMGAIPGMPPGMGKQSHTFQNCVTQKDIEEGGFSKNKDRKQDNCEVKNFKMSGNTATYTMECKGEPKMTADNKITFTSDGFDMDMKMAMNQGGQVMNMNQKMQGRYLGPCKK